MKFHVLVFSALMVAAGSVAQAKDLTNRLGVGYKNQFSVDLPSIAAQYYPNPDMGLSAALGLDTQDQASKFGIMFRAHRIVFRETNLNFYMGGGLGYLSNELAGSTESGFNLAAFLGAEYFFQGLESLGFSFEAGAGVASTNDGTRFHTFGDSPLRAGIMFYF